MSWVGLGQYRVELKSGQAKIGWFFLDQKFSSPTHPKSRMIGPNCLAKEKLLWAGRVVLDQIWSDFFCVNKLST